MVEERQVDADVVALVVADQMDEETAQAIRALKRRGVERVVLIVTRVDDTGLLSALEAGARGVLRRNQATPENLFEAIRAAAGGEGALSPDLLGRLLDQVGDRPVITVVVVCSGERSRIGAADDLDVVVVTQCSSPLGVVGAR